jgi:hypothetical protein
MGEAPPEKLTVTDALPAPSVADAPKPAIDHSPLIPDVLRTLPGNTGEDLTVPAVEISATTENVDEYAPPESGPEPQSIEPDLHGDAPDGPAIDTDSLPPAPRDLNPSDAPGDVGGSAVEPPSVAGPEGPEFSELSTSVLGDMMEGFVAPDLDGPGMDPVPEEPGPVQTEETIQPDQSSVDLGTTPSPDGDAEETAPAPALIPDLLADGAGKTAINEAEWSDAEDTREESEAKAAKIVAEPTQPQITEFLASAELGTEPPPADDPGPSPLLLPDLLADTTGKAGIENASIEETAVENPVAENGPPADPQFIGLMGLFEHKLVEMGKIPAPVLIRPPDEPVDQPRAFVGMMGMFEWRREHAQHENY